MGTDYDANFYDRIREGSRTSSAVVAGTLGPVLLDSGDGTRVLDVGCGEGWFGASFAHGIDPAGWPDAPEYDGQLVGVDGQGVPASAPIRKVGQFVELDLVNDPIPAFTHGRFDLVICLEVAEHLPEHRAAGFVAELCDLAPVVLFSAAIPGQGGTGHVNCRWPAWWAAHFSDHGFSCTDGPRWDLWDDPNVKPWYRQNLLLAVDTERRGDLENVDGWDWHGDRRPLPAVIHPDLWMPEGAPGLDGGGPAGGPRGRRR